MNVPLALFSPGPMEMLIIGVIAVLLFGKRLPEVGRSLGKGIMEFKKGIHGIEDELDAAVRSPSKPAVTHDEIDDRDEATAPKFEPPSEEPRHEEPNYEEPKSEEPKAESAQT